MTFNTYANTLEDSKKGGREIEERTCVLSVPVSCLLGRSALQKVRYMERNVLYFYFQLWSRSVSPPCSLPSTHYTRVSGHTSVTPAAEVLSALVFAGRVDTLDGPLEFCLFLACFHFTTLNNKNFFSPFLFPIYLRLVFIFFLCKQNHGRNETI